MPPGALHQRVTAALADWRLDDAEELLADLDAAAGVQADQEGSSEGAATDPAPATTPDAGLDDAAPSLGRAWVDTLRAELLVRRLRLAGFPLAGEPGDRPADRSVATPAETASRVAQALALVRSAKAAFDATPDDVQRAAGLASHARIELLSARIDAAMDEAVEAASLLDPVLEPSLLLVDTLNTLAGVLADLELMPLALDYQRRAHRTAIALATAPGALGPDDGPPELLVARAATRLAELSAELGEGLLDDGVPDSAVPHFAEARALAEEVLALLPAQPAPGSAGPAAASRVAAQVVHGWALVGLGEHTAATRPLRAAVRAAGTAGNRSLLAAAQLALGRALRRADAGDPDRRPDPDAADEHLTRALALASEHGLPRLRRAALRELCTLHAERDDATRALPYLQAYLADELERVDERRTRWVELFGRRKSLLETERAAGQLRRQAYEDPLTRLPNRRYAEARLDGLLSGGGAPALAVVDVDHFKAINDAVGHPGGDTVLRVVAELLVAGCRDTDEVCRWAGDEFVVLFPETTAEQAERALERIRRGLAGHDWSEVGLAGPVTISVGLASATRGDDRRTLFAAADGVLYEAKRSGRDRVVRLPATTRRSPQRPVPTPPGARGTRESAGGFAPLLIEPPVDVALGTGLPGEPALSAPPAAPAPPADPLEALGGTTGPDVVRAAGLGIDEVLALVREARQRRPDGLTLVVRASPDVLVALAAEHAGVTTLDPVAAAAAVGRSPAPAGRIAVLSSGDRDVAVTAEVVFAARMSGTEVSTIAGPDRARLSGGLPDPSALAGADCLVVVAALDTALAGLVAATTDVPVVAVPTSAGRPGSFGGFGVMLTMLDSSAPGVLVSGVDDGCGAGLFAARIARLNDR